MRAIIGSSISRMLFAALTMFAVTATAAVAQEASGKFTLAKEVRWDLRCSQAGEYTLPRNAARRGMSSTLK